MGRDFDPGPVAEPFATLVREAPDADVYPAADFRVEWGPIFHRGRLDGSARILIVGQDPGQHESIAHRILVGEAGQRVQGFLRKLGLERSYAMLNCYLYSVYGQAGGERHVDDAAIAAYRDRWLDALFVASPPDAVVAFGHLGQAAFEHWREGAGAAHAGVPFEHLPHPTMPEAASKGDPDKRAQAMRKLLAAWNAALKRLDAALGQRDTDRPLVLYGDDLVPDDRAPIPAFDLPAGAPAWWSSVDAWAKREAVGAGAEPGAETEAKRATIVVTVPRSQRPWHDA
jgi:uracil-DNA glycosylase